MRPPTLSLLALFLALLKPTTALKSKQPSNSVLLSNIKSLTLRSGSQTSSRRTSPIPQLTCIGGNARSLYEVDVMRCENSGSDYDDANVQWTCKASLPKEFKLGSTDVQCEGYDSPDDPYVLKGSCGVQYRLVLTEEGERKYGRREDYGPDEGGSSKAEKLLFWAFFTFVAGMILYGVWDSCVRGNNRRGPHGAHGPGGGWGGNDDDDDAPPPYTPYGPKGGPGRGYGTNPANRQWRPGFWSGAGAGAAAGATAGYMAGNRGNSSYGEGSSHAGRRSGGFGSGGSSSSSTPSSSRYESTGFGSSSRR